MGSPNELYEPIEYTMELGGKRIRPTLCLLGTQLFGGEIQDAMNLAMGVEVFHNFTLVHDDIMDEAPLRRGKPTVHDKWNRDVAILSGDVMMVKAYELLCQTNSKQLHELLQLFNQTAIEVCEGQQLDMNFEERSVVSSTDYIEMIRLKTAVLLACSLKMGAINAGASPEEADLLYEFGEKIGIAFQIQDDFLDAYGDPDVFGKRVGGDIISNKKTFLLLTAIEKANEQQKENLNNLLNNEQSDTKKVEAVLNVFNELNISDFTKASMQIYFDQGMEALSKINASKEAKQPLIDLAEQLMHRSH